jgi:hypothetical protein
MLRKIFYFLIAALVIIQFIRPARNSSAGPYPNDITTKFAMNDNVASIFKTSCYDCHSNNTKYPWYANIQPVAWWLQNHVNEGKRELNFNEFATYKEKRQRKKLDEIIEQIKDDEMPLQTFTAIHSYAKLNAEQKAIITKWCEENMATLPAPEPQQQTDNNKTETEK